MWPKFFKKERGLDSYLPYIGFVENSVMFLKSGGFLTTFEIRGKDLSSSTKYELGHVSRIINSALMKLGDGWMAHVDTIRNESRYYPSENECFFSDYVTKAIDASRRVIFESSDTCYENKYYLNLTFTPANLVNKKMFFLFETEDSTNKKEDDLNKILKKYEESILKFINIFSTEIFVKRLSSEEMLSYFHYCISGLSHKVALPVVPMYLDYILASRDLICGFKPKIGNKHIRAIAIKSFPSYLQAGFLEILNNLPFEFRFNSRFIFLDQSTSRKKIEKIRKDWDEAKNTIQSMINDKIGSQSTSFQSGDAVDMMHDADAAVRENQTQELGYGFYTATIVIMNEDEEVADNNANEILKLLEQIGLPGFVESINAVEAYLGSIPGVSFANIRKPIVSTHNLAHLMPLTAAWSGDERHPNNKYSNKETGKKAPPMFYAASEGRTPFRVSLHVSDVGHTLLIGPPGSGKSTLLAFIAAQQFRYKNAQVFAFDKGLSMYLLCKAAGGSHFNLSVSKNQQEEEQQHISFCPLANIDNPDEKSWAIEWLTTIFELQRNRKISPEEQAAITKAIDIMSKETKTSNERILSKFVSQVQNIEIRSAFSPYINKDMYGSIFNGERDFISSAKFNVFEMDELMEKGENILLPALLYMFKVIRNKLDGTPTLLILDEAWVFFKHEIFSSRIEQWLREMRRFNCAVVFATQTVSEIKKSSIVTVILETCKTKIYLANPSVASNKETYEIYESFGLNERQIDIISKAQMKRDYYLSSEVGNRLFEILFDKLTLAFIGVSDRDDIKKAKELMRIDENNWVINWLKYRKISEDWIEYISGLKKEMTEKTKPIQEYNNIIKNDFMAPSITNDKVSEYI